MEAMIAKQEGKEEPLDAKNDKLLHEQLKQLMEDKSHSEKEMGRLKQHNGDSKDKVAVASKSDQASSIPSSEVEVFDNSILKYIQTSKRFQNFLKEKGVLPATSKNATIEGNTRGMGSEVEMFQRPLADQFEEIELQKEILNLRERQLRNRDRNKFLKKVEQESIEKAIAQAKTNHLLHLTNPEREKASVASQRDETATEMQDFQKFAEDYKLLKSQQHQKQQLKKKDVKSSNNKTNETETTPVKDEVVKIEDGSGEGSGSSEDKQQTKTIKTKMMTADSEKATDAETKSSENPIEVTTEPEKINSEKPVVTSAKVEHPSSLHPANKSEEYSENSGFSKRTQKPEVNKDATNRKRNESVSTPQELESVTAVHEEKLTLPINNPKPEATLTLTPNADFISPAINSHERIIHPRHRNSTGKPNEITSERRHNLPAKNAETQALNGKLHMSPAHRRQFSIMEPPSEVKVNKKQNVLERGFIRPNIIVQPLHAAVGPKNLLKHKIPSPNEDVKKSLQMFVHSVGRKGVPRFIRPSSIHTLDVHAVKKGFGKLPQKPKEYLLRELQRDIKLLDKKSKLQQQQQQQSNKTVSINSSDIVLTPKQNVTSHVIVPAGTPAKPTKRSQIQIEDVFNMLKTEDQP